MAKIKNSVECYYCQNKDGIIDKRCPQTHFRQNSLKHHLLYRAPGFGVRAGSSLRQAGTSVTRAETRVIFSVSFLQSTPIGSERRCSARARATRSTKCIDSNAKQVTLTWVSTACHIQTARPFLQVPARTGTRISIQTVRTYHRNSRPHLRSASAGQLVVPSTNRKTLGDKGFFYASPTAWNNIPCFLRDDASTPSLNSF